MVVIGRKKGTRKAVELQGDLGLVFLGHPVKLQKLEQTYLKEFEELTELPSGERYLWAEQLKGKRLYIKKESLIESAGLRVGHFLEEMYGVVEALVVLYSGEDEEVLKELIGRDGYVGILAGVKKPVLVTLVSTGIMEKKDLVDYADNLKKCKASGQNYLKVKTTTVAKETVVDVYW